MSELNNHGLPKKTPRDLFYNAFWDLMKEKPIDQIGIDEISERAGLSRRTFYRHFKSVDDVLTYFFRKKTDLFISHFTRYKPTDYISLAKVSFEYCAISKEFMLVLKKNNKLELYLQYLFEKTSFLMKKIFENNKKATLIDIYTSHFIIGSLYGVLLRWLKSGMIVDVKDMCEVVSDILKSDTLTKI